MLIALPMAIVIGALTRITDMAADDGLRLDRRLVWSAGILYGLLAGYLITSFPALSELGLAILISVLAAGKIDHEGHRAALLALLLMVFIQGIGPLNLPLLALFVAGSALDEFGNALADKKRIRGLAGRFFRLRLTMEALTFAVSAVTGYWILFFSMILYDAGFTYAFPDRVRSKLLSLCGE